MSHYAFILPDLNGGGAQKMMLNIANQLAVSGDNIDLILFTDDGVYKDLVHVDINCISFQHKRSIFAIFSLVKYLRKSKPKALFSALTYVNLIALISKILSFNKKTKIVISERNHLTRNISTNSWFSKKIYPFLVKFLYPKADNIIGISNGVCDDLKNYVASKYHSKIRTIYNPVVTDDFEDKINELSQNLFLNNQSLRLITSGRLEKQKDYPTLFKALANYKEKYGDFQILILGQGSQKKHLEEYAKALNIHENIVFSGFVENPLAAIKQADIFVISSAWEGFCNVIVEALYAGKPVVSTDCPSGPSEILNGGEFGKLVPVRDHAAMCEAIYDAKNISFDPEQQKKRALEFSVQSKAQEFRTLVEVR